MSGSNRSTGGRPDHDIPCGRLKFRTQIATPQLNGLAVIQQGNVLDVEIVIINGLPAVAVYKNSILIGGLAGNMVNKLRDCLLNGYPFKATVTAINGSQVMVDVDPK